MSRNIISWWTIDNGVENIMINGSLKHTLKPVRKTQKRTRALNVELKKYAGLKSYREYVSIKTDFLRNISDNEDSDDETFARSTVSSSDNIADARVNEYDETVNDESHRDVDFADNEEAEEEIEAEDEENENEDIEENEEEEIVDEDIKENEEEEFVDEDIKENEEEFVEEDIKENEEEEFVDENVEENEIEDKKIETEGEEIDAEEDEKGTIEEDESKDEIKDEMINDDDDEHNDSKNKSSEWRSTEIVDEALHRKGQPIITCTEILKSKYTIIRAGDDHDGGNGDFNEDASDHSSEEQLPKIEDVTQENTSPETKRVSQLKRINLLYGSDDSDSSQDDADEVLADQRSRERVQGLASSQVISDPSDSDEWYSNNGTGKISGVKRGKVHNYRSPMSSPMHISDSDNDDTGVSTKIDVPAKEKVVKKSLKSQIDEQENMEANNERLTSNVTIRRKDPSTRNETRFSNRISNVEPTEAETLQYVLRNILSKNNDEDILASTLNTSTPCAEEAFPRPVELNEFIDREGLVHTSQLSTIDIDDIRRSNEEDDEDIWLMEIPRHILTNGRLCGKRIVLEKKRLKIDDACYETIGRKDKFVSCILSAGEDRPRYEAVNVNLVGSIVVRQESSDASFAPLGQCLSALPKTKVAGLVPFPGNIKSRHPLMALNDCEPRSKHVSPAKRNGSVENEDEETSEGVTTEFCHNEIRDISRNDSPSKIPVAPEHKTPRNAKRKSNEANNRKTPLWRRDNFLLPAKKNKKIPKEV